MLLRQKTEYKRFKIRAEDARKNRGVRQNQNRLFKIEIIEKPNTCREKHKKSGRADGMRNI